LNNIYVKLAAHFSLEEKIVKNYLYLSKLAAQMVTSTPSENLFLHFYESQNKNFNFGTLNTLILHARSIFSRGITQQKYGGNPVEVRSFDCTYLIPLRPSASNSQNGMEACEFENMQNRLPLSSNSNSSPLRNKQPV
jgi:hypothetical protein